MTIHFWSIVNFSGEFNCTFLEGKERSHLQLHGSVGRQPLSEAAQASHHEGDGQICISGEPFVFTSIFNRKRRGAGERKGKGNTFVMIQNHFVE